MEKEIKLVEGCEYEMILKLGNEELEPHYEKAYKKARPHIDLQGFRKGKVPLNTVKKLFGKQIRLEADQDIVTEEFNKILQEDQIHMIGEPRLMDINKTDDGVDYHVRYDQFPEIDLVDYSSIVVDEPVHVVDEEEIDKEVENVCRNNGEMKEDTEVKNDQYLVDIKIRKIDPESGMILIGDAKEEETTVYLANETVLPVLKENLLNKHTGDKFRINPSKDDTHAPDQEFEVEVFGIRELVPAEWSNEFAEKYTKGKFTTTEELREEISFQIQEQWDEKARRAMEDDLVDKFVDAHDFPLPKSIVDQVGKAMFEDIKKKYSNQPGMDQITYEMMGHDLVPMAEKQVKWEMIRTAIVKKEEIKVEDHDIDPIVATEAEKYKTDKDTFKQRLMQNENFVMNILNKKLMDFLMDFVETNEITFEELEHKGHDHDHDEDHDHEDVEVEDVQENDVDEGEEKEEKE